VQSGDDGRFVDRVGRIEVASSSGRVVGEVGVGVVGGRTDGVEGDGVGGEELEAGLRDRGRREERAGGREVSFGLSSREDESKGEKNSQAFRGLFGSYPDDSFELKFLQNEESRGARVSNEGTKESRAHKTRRTRKPAPARAKAYRSKREM